MVTCTQMSKEDWERKKTSIRNRKKIKTSQKTAKQNLRRKREDTDFFFFLFFILDYVLARKTSSIACFSFYGLNASKSIRLSVSLNSAREKDAVCPEVAAGWEDGVKEGSEREETDVGEEKR